MAINNKKVELDLDFDRIEELIPFRYKLAESLVPLGFLAAVVFGMNHIARTSSFDSITVFIVSIILVMVSLFFLEKLILAIKEEGFNIGLAKYLIESGKDKAVIEILKQKEKEENDKR